MLNSFAEGKEVLSSRGEQVEIGGLFRIPDVIRKSGCIMVEVGTTNKTHLQDYKNSITKDTGGILYVHTSNYKVIGFTESIIGIFFKSLINSSSFSVDFFFEKHIRIFSKSFRYSAGFLKPTFLYFGRIN